MYKEVVKIRLKEIRKELGLSQYEVSDGTGIDQSKISRFENGEREPTIEDIAKLADFYSVSTDWLLGIGKQKKDWIYNNHKILELFAKVQFCKEIKNNSSIWIW